MLESFWKQFSYRKQQTSKPSSNREAETKTWMRTLQMISNEPLTSWLIVTDFSRDGTTGYTKSMSVFSIFHNKESIVFFWTYCLQSKYYDFCGKAVQSLINILLRPGLLLISFDM